MRTVKDYQEIALRQADTLNEQAARIRKLIREVEAAEEEARSARVMAGKYAEAAGVPVDEESIRLAAAEDTYWRGRLEREHHALAMFQDEIIRNVMINWLEVHEEHGLTADQVRRVIDHIKATNAGCSRYAEQGRKLHEALGQTTQPIPKRKPKRIETYELPLLDEEGLAL